MVVYLDKNLRYKQSHSVDTLPVLELIPIVNKICFLRHDFVPKPLPLSSL